jgi:16S rRNA C967 or C1407 C5-methylase (RsmB/RsmF family)
MLDVENKNRAEAFLSSAIGKSFTAIPASTVWKQVLPNVPWPCGEQERYLTLSPAQHEAGGFFAAVFEKQ